MNTTGVKQSNWTAFFDAFSRRHQGWRARLTILDPKLGAQVEAVELPLQSVVADERGRGITIDLGERAGDVEHSVRNPRRVWIELGEDGSEAAIEIESSDGTKTILEFRGLATPEAVNGLAPAELPPQK
jgi:hypothetical protein